MNAARVVPWMAAVAALGYAAASLSPPTTVRGFDLSKFGALPVLEGGRVKPVDSVARNSMLVIRGKQSLRHLNRTVEADEWLLDVMFRQDVADEQDVFVINDPDVLGLIGLKQSSQRYFSFKTLVPHIEEIEKQANAARQIEAKDRTRFQGAIVNLFDRIYLYYRLQNTAGPHRNPELAFFRPLPENTSLESWSRLGAAWDANEPASFDKAAAELGQARGELLFNRAQPFYLGMVIYVLALLALFTSWLWKRQVLQPTAFALLVVGSIVHTAGLIARVWLQGRPPVTNLYSSAIFVGWTAVVLGIILERIYRRGIGTAVAAAAGFSSLIVAHHLTGDGDTMEMMRAVLDSNFWLATHVITITVGYGGTFLAGAMAIGYTVRKQFVAKPAPETSKMLTSMVYGVICFALFFSFIGTVLGGIWADQSWGRFWGWDPKENGALLIVLWNATILHARWGGYVREKGIMAMAIFGNVITSLSWFGVNMLGVGLHSYGFMESAFWALAGFCASQLVLMSLCLLPARFWRAQPATA